MSEEERSGGRKEKRDRMEKGGGEGEKRSEKEEREYMGRHLVYRLTEDIEHCSVLHHPNYVPHSTDIGSGM